MSAGAVDLHAHTTASDGTLSPRELVRTAARHGVRVLAVTDHDSTEGLAEALEEAGRLGLTVVPGLEINCDVEGAEIHVLGYLGDWGTAWFQDFLRAQRAERVARIHRIAERLTELGLPIDPAEVFALAGDGAPGRPHVAQVMVNRGYVRSVREAFDRYLRAGGPANVPRRRLAPAEAVALIRRAGGVPVLAHPGLAGRDAMIPDLVRAGLMGIEVYYAEHPEYFSLVGGKRTNQTIHGQLCLTNPDVLRIATEQALRWLDEHPDVPILDISQNDGEGACECEKCAAVVAEEGSQHGPILRRCHRTKMLLEDFEQFSDQGAARGGHAGSVDSQKIRSVLPTAGGRRPGWFIAFLRWTALGTSGGAGRVRP